MLALALSLLIADPAQPFPERVPVLLEACLVQAIADGSVDDTAEAHKYLCGGETAERFWAFLEAANVPASEQHTETEGDWLSRYFPLGGCFKRVRMADGSPLEPGLSCSVWIPRPADAQPAAAR